MRDEVHGMFQKEGALWMGSHSPDQFVEENSDQIPLLDKRKGYFYKGNEFTNPDARRPAPRCFYNVAVWPDGSERVLGQVKEEFKNIQYARLMEVPKAAIEKFGGEMESGGVVNGGKRFWATALFPGDVSFGGGDKAKKRLIASGTNDGTGSCIIDALLERQWCQNQLRAIAAAAAIKIPHKGNVELKLEDAERAVLIALEQHTSLAEQWKQFKEIELTGKQESLYLLDALGIDITKTADLSTRSRNIIDLVGGILRREKERTGDSPSKPGTLFQAANAVAEYVDHYKTVRHRNGNGGSGRMASVIFGAGATMKSKSFESAGAIVKSGEEFFEALLEKAHLPREVLQEEQSHNASTFQDLLGS